MKEHEVVPDIIDTAPTLYEMLRLTRLVLLHFVFIISVAIAQDVVAAMKEHEVVPDIIDTAPTGVLELKYHDASANLGNELTPTQVKDTPTVRWNADSGAYYLICMTDPDAPSRANPKMREFRHWLVGNIPGNDVEQGDTLSDYIGSGPGNKTGLHRYVFLVYKQPDKINYEEPRVDNRSLKTRLSFSTKTFAKKYNLGNPVAGNLYLSQFDDYVPILHSQFTGM